MAEQPRHQMNKASADFLQCFLSSLPPRKARELRSRHVSADFFCADEVNANLCADLVLRGEKRATCGLAYWYDSGQERHPQVGDLLIVQDWDRNPVCIVELLSVHRLAFGDVGEDFALAEGEGDKSYTWWRKTHWEFFSNELADLGMNMEETMQIVTEHFQIVWPGKEIS